MVKFKLARYGVDSVSAVFRVAGLRRSAQILLVSMLLIRCAAGATAVVPQGVWQGTLGKKAIVACFNKGFPGSSYGSYYYLDHLEPIAITRDRDAYWHERNDTGLWGLSVPVSGLISGVWRNPKNRKNLPIKLALVDGEKDDIACARDSYNARLETYPKVIVGKWVQFSVGRFFRKLEFAGQLTIELFGPDAATRRLNSILKLDRSREAIAAYFAQRREFLGRVGHPAVDERDTEPVYWDPNFIQIRFYQWAAGEGRSGISIMHRTWNTRTGTEIDPWKWLAGSADEGLPPKLKKFLYGNMKESSECEDGYKGEGSYTLLLNKTGINFEEDAWGNGCEKSFFLTYGELRPFLSPAGILAVNSITASHRKQ